MKLYSLFKKKEFFINPGLERIKEASKYFGNPHKKFKSILISGTNGKGSTAAFLESLFRYHGYKTGFFTSPHLVKENERWQINRKHIEDKKLQFYIEKIKPAIEKFNLTYFEASTLIAFLYFADENVDVSILEVGLGGRWDATNIVEPQLSIITNVSLDHTHLLGETLEKIANEKIGIARENRPLVLGSNQMSLLKAAYKRNIKQVYVFDRDFNVNIKSLIPVKFDYHFLDISIKDIEISLLGTYQAVNCATALTGFIVYNRDFSEQKIKEALKNTYWEGRLQILKNNPVVIIDGAHNEEAVKKSFQEIKSIYKGKSIITVYSGMRDKDFKKILKIIKENSNKVIITKIPVDRGIDETDIPDMFDFVPSIEKAVNKAIKEADFNTIIFITGSLYLIGEVLKIFRGV